MLECDWILWDIIEFFSSSWFSSIDILVSRSFIKSSLFPPRLLLALPSSFIFFSSAAPFNLTISLAPPSSYDTDEISESALSSSSSSFRYFRVPTRFIALCNLSRIIIELIDRGISYFFTFALLACAALNYGLRHSSHPFLSYRCSPGDELGWSDSDLKKWVRLEIKSLSLDLSYAIPLDHRADDISRSAD